MQICEDWWKSVHIGGNPCRIVEICGNPYKSMQICGNLCRTVAQVDSGGTFTNTMMYTCYSLIDSFEKGSNKLTNIMQGHRRKNVHCINEILASVEHAMKESAQKDFANELR